MVKITFAPIKELIIHEAVKVSYDDILRERVTPSGTVPLYWSEGMLFSFSSVPMTRDIVKDYLQGTIHWMEVHYTDMKEYKPVLDLKDQNYGGELKIRVIDTSKSALHSEVAKWLKIKK
ncbi:MAG: hypothetical protein KGH66_01495 [Candidatus Micrarchaeota archaeon]|nr:hypothetical protein [Candidatus Micrarchaeota archaeon]